MHGGILTHESREQYHVDGDYVSLRLGVFLICGSLFAQNAQLPITLLNPTVPVVTGATHTVCSSGCDFTTLQAAWNAASGGDEIVLTAGQTFTSASTLLTLSNKAGNSYILIRSSASCAATGVRAGSAQAASMPKLQVTGNNVAIIDGLASAAHNVYFLCLNITLGPSVTTSQGGLILVTANGPTSGAASNITWDRNWVHSEHLAGMGEDFTRGFQIAGTRMAVINSTVEGFSSIASGQDSQAVLVVGGPGIGLLRNNLFDAATENVMFGGAADGTQTNQVTDWEVSFNYFHKQSGFNVMGSNAKNCYEFKTGVRMWSHDNLFENCFSTSGQIGDTVLITNRPSQSGYGNTANNITFQGNVARHVGHVTNVGGNDDHCGQMTSTVNTAGTALTITAGTQGSVLWADLPVTINGVANVVTSFSSATTGTLQSSAITQTGVALVTIYSQCHSQTNVTLQNNLFEDIDKTYNNNQSVAYAYFINSPFTLFDHNTMIPGVVNPTGAGMYGGAPYPDCMTPTAGYSTNLGITSNIESVSSSGIFADCFNGPSPWLSAPAGVNVTLTNNLVAGPTTGGEKTAWNAVGSSNQFPANYAAIGLLSDNKALSSMSTYFATGAGANLETCFDETAIRNGTVASTSCGTVVGAGSIVSGRVTISGHAVIH